MIPLENIFKKGFKLDSKRIDLSPEIIERFKQNEKYLKRMEQVNVITNKDLDKTMTDFDNF